MGQIQSIDELIGLLIRRRLLIGAIAVFGIVITFLYVVSKPDVFESTAVIQVQSPTVANPDAATSALRENSAQRLQAIQQTLTTRENMLAVIARHKLYADTPLTDDEKVHLLRLALRFETVASAAASGFGQPSEVSALLVSAQADSRSLSAQVTNDFAQGILDAGANTQMNRAREAVAFYRDAQNRLKAQIDTLSAQLSAFQAENRDALPAQRDLINSELTGIETELRTLDQTLVGAQNERATIERKTTLRATDRRQLETLIAQIETLSAQSNALQNRRAEILATLAAAQDTGRTMAEFQRNLEQLQSQYEVAVRRSTDAETDAKLQDRQQGETFTLLERAVEPDYPISGGRRKLAAMGAVASLLAGIGAAFLLDMVRPVIRTSSQLERELDLRAIVAIPELDESDRSLRQSFLKDIPRQGNLTQLIGSGPAKANDRTGARAMTKNHAILGGVVVILLVAVATLMT
jgi:tyrosine-protein kinase Etk/Wzc